MKKIFVCMLALLLVCALCACSENDGTETSDTAEQSGWEADLALDALETLLREKGDALSFADIPEMYFYQIPYPMIPQLAYPIGENITFYITQMGEAEYSMLLYVSCEEGDSAEYEGAEEILTYIESLR